MQTLKVSATTQYLLGNSDPTDAGQITIITSGMTANCSAIPSVRPLGTGTDELVQVPYTNVGTGASVTAGTAITADGIYQITSVGPEVLLDATYVSGTAATVWFWTTNGGSGSGSGGGGGGGGGGAITIASGAVASGAYSSGSFAAGAIRDGADVALGLTTSAAVTGDNDGAVNAHLRGLTKIAADEWDATNHRQYVALSDGTHYSPSMDAVSRAGFQKITDGTNTMPTMDAIARKGFQQLTDGTTAVGVDVTSTGVKVAIAADLTAAPTTPLQVSSWNQGLTLQQTILAASTAAQATDIPAVVALHPSSPLALATGAAVKVTDGTNFQPTGDTVARKIFVATTDGTNTAAVKAASTASVATDPALVIAVSPNNVVKVGDGTTSLVIKAASTAAVAGDTSAVVAISPNNVLKVGDGTTAMTIKAASTAVVATDPAIVVGISPNNVPVIAGTTTLIIPTFTVTASAYAAGNCMGGLMSLASAMRVSGGTGVWSSLVLVDHGNQKPLLDVLLFKSSPSGTFTDKSAFPTMSTADNARVLARISVVSTDWVTIGGSAYATIKVNVAVGASGGALLYTAMNVTSGTPTPAATNDMGAVFTFLCD